MKKNKYIVIVLLAVLFQSLSVFAEPGTQIARQLKFRFNQSENQKAWIQSLGISEDEQNQILELAKKTGLENTPVPNATQSGAVLILKNAKGDTRLDFSKIQDSVISLNGKAFHFGSESSLKDFYNAFQDKKAISELWISPSYAEDGSGTSWYAKIAGWVAAKNDGFWRARRESLSKGLANEIHGNLLPHRLQGALQCEGEQFGEALISMSAGGKVSIRGDSDNQGKLKGISLIAPGFVEGNCFFPYSEKNSINKKDKSYQKCSILKKTFDGKAEDIFPIESLIECCRSKGCPVELAKIKPEKTYPSLIVTPVSTGQDGQK